MDAAVGLRGDFGADELRRLAAKVKDAAQARRLLALAAVRDGMNRTEAARIGGMDRQALRDWAHRFNQCGPDGLIDIKPTGRPSKLSDEQKEALKQLVETGPDPEKDGVVRWRCVDLKRDEGRMGGQQSGEAINLLIGLLLLSAPIAAALAVPFVFAVLLLVRGVALVALAFRLRN
jgi:transposase